MFSAGLAKSKVLGSSARDRRILLDLWDIGENVHEWCTDWFDRDYYARSPEPQPTGTGNWAAARLPGWFKAAQ
jgi:hypothetical protein